MKYIHRELEKPLAQATRHFPAVVLTGPRRAGKTMLLRRLFPKASYFLLEDPDVVARLRADPQGFFDAVKTPAILDAAVHWRWWSVRPVARSRRRWPHRCNDWPRR